ncbi:MAG: glycosyltransferase family 39 protein [Promethearchaeota archaeon]
MKIADRKFITLICGAILITLSVYYTIPIAQTRVLFVGITDYQSTALNINGEYIEPQDLPEFASALLEYYDIIVIKDDALTDLHRSQTQALRDYAQGGGDVYIIGNTRTDFGNNVDTVQLDTILKRAGGIGLPQFFLFDIYYGIIPVIIGSILLGYGITLFKINRKKWDVMLYSILFMFVFYRIVTNLYYLQIGPITRTEDPTLHILLTELLIYKSNVADFAPIVLDTPLAYPIGFHALCAVLSIMLGSKPLTIVINCGAMLSAMLPLMMYILGRELDEYTGLMTAYITAVLPWIFTIFAFGMYSNILGYIFYTIMLYSLFRGIEKKSMRHIGMAGAFFGILVLVHLILSMSVIIVLSIYILVLILQKRTIRCKELHAIALMILIAIPVSLFWTSRGLIVFTNNILGGFWRIPGVTNRGVFFLRFDLTFFLQNLENYFKTIGVLSICVLNGVLISFKKRTSKELFLLSWILPLFILASCFGFPYFHFYRGFVLAICVVGGYGFRNLPTTLKFIQSKLGDLQLLRVDERVLVQVTIIFVLIVSLYHSTVQFHVESKEMYLDEAHILSHPTDATIRAAIWLSNYDTRWCRIIVVGSYDNPWIAVYSHKLPMLPLISDIESQRGITQQARDRNTILSNLHTLDTLTLLEKYDIGYFVISDHYDGTYDHYNNSPFLKLIYEKDGVRIYAVTN